MSLTFGSVFSGGGGLDIGLERAGMRVVWQSEIDPLCCAVLKKHWPDVPNLGAITEIDWTGVEPVDLICGGFPCQDVSLPAREGLALEKCLHRGDMKSSRRHESPNLREQVVQPSGYSSPSPGQPSGTIVTGSGAVMEHTGQLNPDAVCWWMGFQPGHFHCLTPRKGKLVYSRSAILKALGNAVVPQVAEYVGRCIMAFDEGRAK